MKVFLITTYSILIGIIIYCLIILFNKINILIEKINLNLEKKENIDAGTNKINEDVLIIKECLEHAIPFFGFIIFIILILSATIKEYKNTKRNKRNFVKTAVKQYNIYNLRFSPRRSAAYRKEFLDQLKKLA